MRLVASKTSRSPLRYPSHSISVERMIDHVNLLKKDNGRLMATEFESIDPGGQFTWEVSSRPENRSKNRYANVVAYDHSRIVLQKIDGVPDSDYINANYLDGYHRKNMYIATQGPLPNTIVDFWRMVWEQRSSIIVAMTRLEERTRIKCEQYWPAVGHGTRSPMSSAVEGWSNHAQPPNSPTSNHIFPPHRLQDNLITHRPGNSVAQLCQVPLATVTHGQITVDLLSVVELAYYTIRTFSLQKSGSQEKREVRQLQFTAWPDHGVPNHPAPLLMFLRRVNSEHAPETGPIIVHCSAGVGRTGRFLQPQCRRCFSL
ncbi:unnamed protein product [Schistocephalus solidus]|uniref:Tyrosine-protein phosphatase domain-containing protein n=1 Tax=Schistocephalus solidus TaxID=70667 RepID=A0A183SAP9_SCHSO|nr:unnamed protein product [Schistocephalus solidus]